MPDEPIVEPEVPVEEEPVIEEKPEDIRLKKMVNILLKDLGEVKGLEGKNLNEQFDMLEFLSSNKIKSKPGPKPKAKNKPIVGKPTKQDKRSVGRVMYKNGAELQMRFDPVMLFTGEYKKMLNQA